jgi:hypothetical protein
MPIIYRYIHKCNFNSRSVRMYVMYVCSNPEKMRQSKLCISNNTARQCRCCNCPSYPNTKNSKQFSTPAMDAAALQKLAGAVENGKKRSLNSFLGTSNNSPLGKTLIPSPINAKALLETYQMMLGIEDVSPREFHTLSRLQMFQALLMIYPSYDTPWSAMEILVSKFRELQADEAFHCVSAIDMFLEDASSTESGPNIEVLDGFVRKVVNRIWKQTLECSEEQRVLLGDLLLGILQFCEFHMSKTFYDQICLAITKATLVEEAFPIWIEVMQKLCPVLSKGLVDEGRDRALEYLRIHGNGISLISCYLIIDASFKIAKSHCSWYRLSIQLLTISHTRRWDYVNLEQYIEKCLSRLPEEDFKIFCRIYDSETIHPEWVRLSSMLVLYRCSHESTAGLVNDLLSSALNISADSSDEGAHISYGDKALDCLFQDEEVKGQLELIGGEDDKFLIVEVLNDLTYAGGDGLVVDPDGSKVNSLSKAAKLILGALYCGTRDLDILGGNYFELVTERNRILLSTADYFLAHSENFRQVKAILFFALCVTIMYSANNLDRCEIVDQLSKGVQSRSDCLIRKNASIATVGLIIRSASSLCLSEEILEFLKPCTTLLDGRRIDTATFMHIATFMTGSSVTRESLLQCCERVLCRNSATAWKDGDNVFGCYLDEMRAGLFGLLELLYSDSWGDLERQAWMMFSDCLVLNKPQINISDRKWIYEQVTESLMDDDSESSTWIRHLLRAAIARLGIFMVRETEESSLKFVPGNSFVVWEDPSTSLSQTRQVEDIFRLLRLSFLLLFHGLTRRGEASARGNELKCWEELSRFIQKRSIPKSVDRRGNSVATVLSVWLDDGNVLELSFAALLACLVAVYGHLLLQTHDTDIDISLRNDETLVLERCFNGIMKNEMDELVCQGLDQSAVVSLPHWVRRQGYDLFSTREIDVDEEWLTSLHLSLCDLLMESIGGHYLRRVPIDARSLAICTNVVLAVGSVLEVRRDLQGKEQSIQGNSNERFDLQTFALTSAPFFLAASQCIESSLRQELSMETASSCLDAAGLFCRNLVTTSNDVEIGPWLARLHSAWALYQTVASEKGSTRFIGYLESTRRAEKKQPKADASVCSLRSIRSSEDVDETVRSLRFHVLNALEKCLGFATMNELEVNNSTAGEGLVIGAVLIARVCREIAQDLRSGLDGHSGGITTEMYESYLRTMQTCATCIETISRRQDFEMPPGTFDLLVEVIDFLRDVLRSYPIEDAVLFRSTLIMAIAEFPSLIRDGVRKQHGTLPRESISEMLQELFDDCMTILKRWSAIRDPNVVPWEDIAGERHVGEIVGLDAGRGVMLDRPKEPKSPEVRFRGKEIWSWALSCSFVAMEKEWHEAFEGIISARERHDSTMKGCIDPGTLSFLAIQRERLRSAIFRIAKLFHSSTPEIYAEGQGAALDVLAMNLPSAPRRRFCHLIAAMSKVLRYAVDHVWSCMYNSTSGHPMEQGDATLSFLEALSTIEPWLCFDDTENEFAVGTFRWLSILRRKLPPGTQRARYVDTAELLPWVSKVATLNRDLPSSLRNVIALLRHDDCLAGLEASLRPVFPAGRDALLKTLTRKLSLLESAMPGEYSSPPLPTFPTIGLQRTVLASKKRSMRHKSQLRHKKRAVAQVPKSRNSIVNAFMSLDRNSSENDGAPDDAFIDLEDFLVDG